jgi:hypothetical protein
LIFLLRPSLFYGLELHHLNPNSICHIAIFIHFCEAFLGIEPHWDLFRFLFRVKPHPTAKNLSVVGGAGIQLRQQAGDRYLSYKFPSNIPGWKNHWFYIENHAPQLPEKSGKPPVMRPEWNTELSRADLDQVDELLAIIAAQKEIGVTGASVMFSFFKRRIQPIQQRHTLGFECDSSSTCKLGIVFVNVKYVLVSVKLVCVYVKLLKT